MTLVELLVAITILGLMAGIAGLAFHTAPRSAPPAAVATRIAQARTDALRTGQPVTISVVDSSTRPAQVRSLTALPDGSIIADAGLDIDRFTGRTTPAYGARAR